MDVWLVIAGTLALLSAATAAWTDHLPVSAPAVAATTGVVLGPAVLGVLTLPTDGTSVLVSEVARLTLAVSLVAIALRFPVPEIRRRGAVGWLVLLVLPGMVLLTWALASPLLGLGAATAAVLAASLAPTDPVLASSVITGDPASRDIPVALRQSLSIESAANDGLATPFVVVTVAWAAQRPLGTASLEALWSVVGGVAVGAALGWVAAHGLTLAERHGGTDRTRTATFSLVLALTVLGTASLLHTADLLAVFAAGLVFNAGITNEDRTTEELVDESVDRFLVLPMFVLVGAVLPWDAWAELGWRGPVFAIGVLVLRRLPLALLLRRTLGTDLAGAVWLGWFGPIAVAAVYYLTALPSFGLDDPQLWEYGSLVVAASILLHGVTAAPGRVAYARAQGRGRDDGA